MLLHGLPRRSIEESLDEYMDESIEESLSPSASDTSYISTAIWESNMEQEQPSNLARSHIVAFAVLNMLAKVM